VNVAVVVGVDGVEMVEVEMTVVVAVVVVVAAAAAVVVA
jgi:hypothetical protein